MSSTFPLPGAKPRPLLARTSSKTASREALADDQLAGTPLARTASSGHLARPGFCDLFATVSLRRGLSEARSIAGTGAPA
jgi:hypothetical protein